MIFRTKFLFTVCFDLRSPKLSHNRLRRDFVPRLLLFSKVSCKTSMYKNYTYFSLWAKFSVWGGVGGQFPRNIH